jgi:glycosyltransferase involved in cell wall biosynthesis
MDAAPVVSVIIIFLNAEAFLAEAIESVRAQTFADWELLLVDDGSTDASSAIARAAAAADPRRVRTLQHDGHQNRGMSASRNLGIAEARGEFIAFLDADDVWLCRRLEAHLAVLRRFPEAAMVYGPTLYWFSWQRPDGASDELSARTDAPGEMQLSTGVPLAPGIPLLSFLETGGGSLPGICSILARRHAALAVGGFEADFRGSYEDQVFLSKMALNFSLVVHDEVLDRYRQHVQSCSWVAIKAGEYHPDRPHQSRRRYLEWLEHYLAAEGVRAAAIQEALRLELLPYRHPWRYRARRLGGVRPAEAARAVARRVLPRPVKSWLQRHVLPQPATRP